MPQILLIIVFLSVSLISHAQPTHFLLQAEDELTVVGEIEIRLAYGDISRASFLDTKVKISRDDQVVMISSDEPAVVHIDVPCLAKLKMLQGQLLIKVEGNQRLELEQVQAPEIRVRLLGRARFDSEVVATEHLQVALSEQGKASLKYVEADLFELVMTDHGDLDVAGLAREQQVELSGYAHYDAADLKSDDVTVALDDYSAGFIQAKNTPTVDAAPYTSLSSL